MYINIDNLTQAIEVVSNPNYNDDSILKESEDEYNLYNFITYLEEYISVSRIMIIYDTYGSVDGVVFSENVLGSGICHSFDTLVDFYNYLLSYNEHDEVYEHRYHLTSQGDAYLSNLRLVINPRDKNIMELYLLKINDYRKFSIIHTIKNAFIILHNNRPDLFY